MPMRIGVLGGTFNPVHMGHLRAAEEAVETLRLDTFYFLPAPEPPHKPRQKIISFAHRWKMLNLAIADNPRLQASDLELRWSGKSYSVLTLNELHKENAAGSEVFFLLGLDAFLEINTWYHYRELFELACMVVLRRPSYCEEDLARMLRTEISGLYTWNSEGERFLHPSLLPVYYLKITRLDISSTQVRGLARQGKSIRYLVPPEVRSYIITNNLYSSLDLV
jgi:nicotinate-nucleotide adenylyltransferase